MKIDINNDEVMECTSHPNQGVKPQDFDVHVMTDPSGVFKYAFSLVEAFSEEYAIDVMRAKIEDAKRKENGI